MRLRHDARLCQPGWPSDIAAAGARFLASAAAVAIRQGISLQMLLHQIEGNKRPYQPLASALRTYAIDALLELLGASLLRAG
jgi:hypothetical protein